jgi:hypothetical protein
MSEQAGWAIRSQKTVSASDHRVLQWRYEKELEPTINSFLDDSSKPSLVIGSFNLDTEPWRLSAVISFRKYNLKILEKKTEEITEITVVKQRLSRSVLG